jgi:predicted nucleotidyltransferase component of viral defense system
MIDKKFVNLYAVGNKIDLFVAERDVILTYVLKIFHDNGFLKTLAFKGGTALRKVHVGDISRFSEDLDFTGVDFPDHLDFLESLNRIFSEPQFGISFKLENWGTSTDEVSLKSFISYAHEWNSAHFEIDISLRKEPILPIQNLPLVSQLYFKYLPFSPPPVPCLNYEEAISEKIRACFQRLRARDVYDLWSLSKRPMNKERVRSLAVLKCWQVGDEFKPDKLLSEISSAKFAWQEVERLVRGDQLINQSEMVETCLKEYAFLTKLTLDEEELARDSRKHELKSLYAKLCDAVESM